MKNFIVDPFGLEWDSEILSPRSYAEGKEYAKKNNLFVPERWELIRLVDWCLKNGFKGFEDMRDLWFGSSSSSALNANCAWVVDFYYGYVSYDGKDYNYSVRCVRRS